MSDLREKKLAALKEIAEAEALFVTGSMYTSLPYFTQEETDLKNKIDVYLRKEDCEAHAKALCAQERMAFPLRVPHDAVMIFFSDLYSYGVDIVRYHGSEACDFAVGEIVTRSVPEGMQAPPENIPLERALISYMQEARRPKQVQRDELREGFLTLAIREIWKAQFLIPLAQKEIDGEIKSSFITVQVMNGPEKVTAIPIFTDGVEFRRAVGDKDFQVGTSSMKKLVQIPLMEGCAGFVINPSSTSMVIPEQLLNYWKTQADKE